MTLDTHLTFTQHCNNIAVKVLQRNNVMKALAGSTGGYDKETLLTTYQAIDRSILSYCCPVWTRSTTGINWSRLLRAQNSAQRIATCCLNMAMLPNCIKRFGNYQFASITSLLPSSSPLHAIYHNIPAISSATNRQITDRKDDVI